MATSPLNNTILVPYHDSLASKQLPENNAAASLSKFKGLDWDPNNSLSAYIKVNDGAAQKLIAIQNFAGLGMMRDVKTMRSGGNGDYQINLPGAVTYSDVTIWHVYTKEHFFLDWMKAGVTRGGAARADIEIHLKYKGEGAKEMIFTLRDAFPVKWELYRELDASQVSSVLSENITITFSKIDFKINASSAS